ncbi:hypothetical protein niasHT_015363 [Heterodera trifolii]|uniref:Ubiquitin-like protease family profile domain-containing protein n=1 Tax=Heterodera trifolii TaxID=157864 RepID=A0ABD2KZV3_9BILA
MENDFTINSCIALSDPQQCGGQKTLMRKGEFIFNSHEQSFTAKIKNKTILHLLPSHLCKLRKERCPSGRCLIIRYKKPDESIKELGLKELAEDDKLRIHSLLLAIAGVEKEITQRKVESDRVPTTKIEFDKVPPRNNGLDNRPTWDIDKMLPRKTDFNKVQPRNIGWNNIPSWNIQLDKIPPMKTELDKIPPRKNELDKMPSKKNELDKMTPRKIESDKMPLCKVKVEMVPLIKDCPTVANTAINQPNVTVRVLKRPPLDLPRTPVKRPKPDFLLTNENKENLFTPVENGLEMPEHEKSLPERFTCPNFWSDLKSDERLRSGENGEWVKGQDERLTIDGLLCLCDGQWLNADIIDCYLDLICRCSPRAHFIPTYAILSYGRKGTVPSEWYWQLAETDTIFAPAHLYNNHWAMAILDMRERTLRLMDSMNHGYTDTEKREFMETIMNILRDVAILQKVDIGDRSAWDVQERLSVPQQRNGTDCGIFALLFAQYSLERRQLEFGQCHIPYFRRRICHDIISVILHDQKSPVNRSDETVVQCPFAL